MNRSESLNLSIGSEGPLDSGWFATNKSLEAILYNPNTSGIPAGSWSMMGTNQNPSLMHEDPNGIGHFTNWEAKLSSLQVDNKERFESSSASNYLGYQFNAKKIKIVNDIAAISYPEYTDINKTIWEHENGGIYQPWLYGTDLLYDVVIVNYQEYQNYFFLPLLNKHALNEAGIEGFFDNLFIVLEYDGYYSDGTGAIDTRATGTEVFRYVSEDINQPGTFFFDPLYGFPILRSRYDVVGPATYFTDGSNSDARITNAQVTEDVYRLENEVYNSQGTTAQTILNQVTYNNEDNAWGFIGYSKCSLIKYQPVVKCGRVDLYQRKTGIVTAFTNDGIITSANHDLQNGDIIKFVGGLDSLDKDGDINGVKYVQVNDQNSFVIYNDDQYAQRTYLTDTQLRSNIQWALIGNTNDLNRQGWSFKQTLYSPNGKNGVTQNNITWGDINNSIDVLFNGSGSYVDVLERDIGFEFDNPSTIPSFSNLYASNISVRDGYSRRDALWAGPHHYLSDYKFGSGIDLIQTGTTTYKLLVGECGPDEFFRYSDADKYYNLPNVGPYGKAHLIDITVNGDKSLSVSLNTTINASTNDAAIITPPEISTGTPSRVMPKFYYPYSNLAARLDTATSQTYNDDNDTQEYISDVFNSRMNYINDPYWYGAMLYHVPQSFRGLLTDNAIFSNVQINEFNQFGVDAAKSTTPYTYQHVNGDEVNCFYAFVDNFGKDVALQKIGSNIIAAISSTVKPDTTSANSTGYIHVYDFTAGSKLQKLSHSAVTPYDQHWLNYYDHAQDFGKCVVINNNKLYFGQPKCAMFISNAFQFNETLYDNEISRIYCYNWDGSEFTFNSTALNENNFNLSYVGNEENYHYDDGETLYPVNSLIFPTDRFGANFAVDNDILVTNSLDIANDLGQVHDDISYPQSMCDYLCVYEFINNKWVYVSKISPTINSTYSKYSYTDLLYPNASAQLRPLGNKSYDNSRLNSITWDVDLTNSYVIADDRIILKDPLGYAIFRRNWQYSANANVVEDDAENSGGGEESTDPVVPLPIYFKYQEEFTAYEENNKLLHTKFSNMYKYNTTDTLQFTLTSSNNTIIQKTPIYFFAVPEFSPLDVVKISIKFNGTIVGTGYEDIKLALYRRDPRINFTIDEQYANKVTEYTQYEAIPGGLFLVDKEADGRYIGRNGAMDAWSHHDYTDFVEEPWAKLLSGTASNIDTLDFYVGVSDLTKYILGGSRLQNAIRVFNRGPYDVDLALDLLDIDKVTYDSTVVVNKTLIAGLVLNESTTEKLYRAPLDTENKNINKSIGISSITAYTNVSPPISDSSTTVSRKVISLYDCINDVVSTYSNFKYQTGQNGRLRYTNPILGIGTSATPSHYDGTENGYIYDGTFSKSYQLLTVNDFYTASGSYNSNNFDGFTNETRSFDVQKLEYLPLILYTGESVSTGGGGGGTDGGDPLTLHIDGLYGVNSGINLHLKNVSSSGTVNLFLNNASHSGTVNLITFGSVAASGNMNLFIGQNHSSGWMDLYTVGPRLFGGGIDLHLETPKPASGYMPLYIKGRDPLSTSSNMELVVYGSTDGASFNTSNIPIVITGGLSGDPHWDNMPLSIFAPGGDSSTTFGENAGASGSMPLYIGYVQNIVPSSGNLGIYIYNTDTQNINWQKDYKSTNLTIRSTYGYENNIPLHIHRTGTGGGEEYGESVDVIMYTPLPSGQLNLHIPTPVYAATDNLNLLLETWKLTGKELSQFIRGYEE